MIDGWPQSDLDEDFDVPSRSTSKSSAFSRHTG